MSNWNLAICDDEPAELEQMYLRSTGISLFAR